MKRLYLLRHAKSSWENIQLKDFDRPLANRGEADIPRMVRFFNDHFSVPDKIIASPATRTTATASAFAEGISYHGQIEFISDIYEAHHLNLVEIVQNLPENAQSTLMVGHNPGVTNLAAYLSTGFITENIPTCGLVVLDFNSQYWHNISEAQGRLVRYMYPKGINI